MRHVKKKIKITKTILQSMLVARNDNFTHGKRNTTPFYSKLHKLNCIGALNYIYKL